VTCSKEIQLRFILFVTATEMPGMSNVRTSMRTVGQRAGNWLSALKLKDVKDKVQSVAPALPKLIPDAVVLTDPNRASKPNSADNMPANFCEGSFANERERELRKESNHCEYVRPMDVISASESVSNDYLCDKESSSELTQLSSELATKLCVDNSSVTNGICDQNSVASTELDAVRNNIIGEHTSRSTTEYNVDCLNALSSAQTSSCDIEQSLPSADDEAQQFTELKSQPVVVNPPTDIRMFSTFVSDSPEIIFSSSRKKRKSTKQGIYILHYICYATKECS